MKKRNLVLFFIFALALFSSCVSEWSGVTGKGNSTTETRIATGFQSIQLFTSANVTIIKDTLFKVEVEDYANIVKYISANVVNHSLIISIYPLSTILINSQAKVRISMPDSLIGLSTSGSGKIDVDSTFKDVQNLLITGSGNINLNKPLKIKNLKALIIGSGNITASGNTVALTASTSGSGNMNLSQLIATKATCAISGSGKMYINAVDSLNAVITGSGNIEYSGNPGIKAIVTGTGSITKK